MDADYSVPQTNEKLVATKSIQPESIFQQGRAKYAHIQLKETTSENKY